MTTMLEKAAKAMWDARDARTAPKHQLPWAEASEAARDITRLNVMAALLAIREPSEAMVREYMTLARRRSDLRGEALARARFTAMIDAILTETPQ